MSVEEVDMEFRVRVSLERYFSDERARCYMSLSRRRPVRWLARRLRRAFSLPRPFALLSRGHLLPPDEPLAVLAPDDPVDVIPTSSEETLPVKQLEPDSDEGRRSDVKTSDVESAGPAASSAEAALRLRDMKLRALHLLRECAAQPARTRRRRRVRRRRAASTAPAGEGAAADEDEEVVAVDEEAVAAGEEAAAADEEVEAVDEEMAAVEEAAVLRNGAAESRAPRLVRAV